MNKRPSERREYFRINDRAILKTYEASNNDNLESLKRQHASFLISSTINEIDVQHHTLYNRIKRANPDILQYFDAINSKIEIIANFLLNDSLDLDSNNLTDIDLSASGIAFENSCHYKIDDRVLIKLMLMPEKKGILCLGKVVRIRQQDNVEICCIDFIEITESDRELIIKHSIGRQLEEARQRNQQ